MKVGVTVEGADAARKAVAGLGASVAGQLAQLDRQLTAQLMQAAHGWGPRNGRQTAAASRTLRPATRGAGATLPASPAWNAGAEFGSNRYPQFHRWRGSGANAGYFLFPALREVNMMQAYSDMLADQVKAANHG